MARANGPYISWKLGPAPSRNITVDLVTRLPDARQAELARPPADKVLVAYLVGYTVSQLMYIEADLRSRYPKLYRNPQTQVLIRAREGVALGVITFPYGTQHQWAQDTLNDCDRLR